MKHTSTILAAALLLGPAMAQAESHGPVQSTIEFGPCTEFIGGYYVPAEAARVLVPEDYDLDVQENGVIAQVRAINCASIAIQSTDGTSAEGGEHIVYQLGVAVLPPVKLDDNPNLAGAPEVTEYHAYAYNTLTNFAPLAEAMTRAGIDGVHVVDDLTFAFVADEAPGCGMMDVTGSIASPAELALNFSGTIRDPGTSTTQDGCEFGENDITTSERAVWYTDGAFGIAMSDTAVPRWQRLLFNADPATYQPIAVPFEPQGATMLGLAGDQTTQFSFTMSGLLERGEVTTILRPVTEK